MPGDDVGRERAAGVGHVVAPRRVAVPGQVDREGGQAEREDRRVPRVGVEPGAVEERDDRALGCATGT